MLPCRESRNIEEKAEDNILDLQIFIYLLASWKIKLDGKVSRFQQKQNKPKPDQTKKQTTGIEKKYAKVALLNQT